jgi:phage-related holin
VLFLFGGDSVTEYIEKTLSGSKPWWAFLLSGINYIFFPDQALLIAFYAVGIAMMMDILTKYRAIGRNNGGVTNARKIGKLSSKQLWFGTKDKLFTYFVIFIFAGLSYRVTVFKEASVFLSTVAYTVIFLREFQSCLENLDEAGSDVGWLLIWTKRKQQQILESEIKEGSGEIERI